MSQRNLNGLCHYGIKVVRAGEESRSSDIVLSGRRLPMFRWKIKRPYSWNFPFLNILV
jgi:hypothetical protein